MRMWRAGCVHEQLEKTRQMQLLVHPEWWEEEREITRRESVERFVTERNNWIRYRMDKYLLSMEQASTGGTSNQSIRT